MMISLLLLASSVGVDAYTEASPFDTLVSEHLSQCDISMANTMIGKADIMAVQSTSMALELTGDLPTSGLIWLEDDQSTVLSAIEDSSTTTISWAEQTWTTDPQEVWASK